MVSECRWLPVTAGRTSAVALGDARTRSDRRRRQVLLDRERVARLRLRDDGVAVVAWGRDGHLALAAAEVKAALGHVVAGERARVGLLVRVERLDVRDQVTGVRLGARVLALLALTKERRQRDRRQDADDQDDHEELDKGEALLLAVNTLAELPQHVSPSLLR